MEVHRDIYGYTPSLYRTAMDALARDGLAPRVDRARMKELLTTPAGVPVRVSAEAGKSSPVATAAGGG
jgi:hypothetical protein